MVKFIKDLTEQENETFIKSDLYRLICADFYFLPNSLSYDKYYFGESYKDYSLIVFQSKKPVIAMFSFTNNNHFSFYGWPVSVFHVEDNLDELNLGYKELFSKISEISVQNNISSLLFFENPYFISKYFYKIEAIKTQHYAIIDLRLSEESIKSNLRTSNKTQVNWGMKNLQMVLVDHNNPDKKLFDDYKTFHIQVSGRQTRSDETWELQFEMLENKQAYLALAYLNERLVSGTLILHGNETAYYGVTVNDRELMKERIPVGYYPILFAMYHARKIGLKKFHMNKIDQNLDDQKLKNLANFKEGFTKTIETRNNYLIHF